MGIKLKAIESKINQAEKQLQEARQELAEYMKSQKLPVPKIGGTIEIMGLKWFVLDKTENGYLCLAERLKDRMQFDTNCNDWKESNLREYLNTDFFEQLASEVGKENIVTLERDLLSLDGQTEYGTCKDKVSLISFDEYRKYRPLIPNTGDYYWWTITPDSTKCNGITTWVRIVSPSGFIGNGIYDISLGVRPFCIFSSAIFESEEK